MSSRRPFVGGNWKCTGSYESISRLVKSWNQSKIESDAEIVIGVPSVYMSFTKSLFNNGFNVASENCFPRSGAFTGEVSVDMLKDLSIEYCILGHSERRHIFGEKNESIAEKAKVCVENGIIVIGCIGETLEQREQGKMEEVIVSQMKPFIECMKGLDWSKFVVAYEPVWSIGTGVTATPNQAQAVHEFIRELMRKEVSEEVAKGLRIIYGGSVKPHNCGKLYEEKDIDGFLVGGASLAPSFVDIINSTKEK